MAHTLVSLARGQFTCIPYHFTQTRLKKMFAACVAVTSVFVLYRIVSHGSTGFAHVHSVRDLLKAPPGKTGEEVPLVEQLPLFRDLYTQEAWPEISRARNVTPDKMSHTVHYVWCQTGEFRYEHYLGVLSALRLLHPLKLVFHFSQVPSIDRLWYHLWFWELKQSFASLELRPMSAQHKRLCQDSGWGRTEVVLDILSRAGGFYIAPKVVLTRFPGEISWQQPLYWQRGKEKGSVAVLFSLKEISKRTRREFVERMRLKDPENTCRSVEEYNTNPQLGGLPKNGIGGGGIVGRALVKGKSGGGGTEARYNPPCVIQTNQIYPKDVMTTRTPFAELGRWLYYGTRKVLEAKQSQSKSPSSSIPRIGHVTWLAPPKDPTDPTDPTTRKRKFLFLHFLSLLSALHVAGLRHVYVHGDVKPEGPWWERLRGENVTFVSTESVDHVFQQTLADPAHRSDVIRAQLLRIFGGVYMDVDVLWVNRLPDDLLRYPTVVCPDWARNGEWPVSFNTGVLMSQSNSPWLRHFLSTMRRYVDTNRHYNPIMMPYRTYELYPESLHIDYYLQVICLEGNCHPTWHEDYIRNLDDSRPPGDFHWREPRAYHFLSPSPPPSLKTPAEIQKRLDVFAEVGHFILTKSGRGWLVGEP